MIDGRQLGGKIAELRRSKGMTQTELAAQLNVTHQAVSKWERGESLPDLPTFARLSVLLGVRTDELLGLEASEKGEHQCDAAGKEKVESAESETVIPLPVTLEDLDAEELWREVTAHARKTISLPSFNTWIKNTEAVIENGALVVFGASPFQRDWLRARYHKMFVQQLKLVTGLDCIPIEYRSRQTGASAGWQAGSE
ncbi:helix-turn-helix domain-containing protein [Paenibacillus ginsengarvi]|uniref:Helix-turn-helix domain-containing protein n=1 Tax=Paenibacillus ginsengarvi TaxID=400777 RepID=A0A3B0C0K7_9BACL|nr:helix-turn-helix domain-containing protein [Paenibacillus ginsengarvi]RKN78198.1 helix-turn-helix domain-containing protein [Paenibacillus ginsengarvi]